MTVIPSERRSRSDGRPIAKDKGSQKAIPISRDGLIKDGLIKDYMRSPLHLLVQMTNLYPLKGLLKHGVANDRASISFRMRYGTGSESVW